MRLHLMLLDLDHPLTFEVSKLRQIEALIYLSTNMISQLQESFPLRRAAGSFEISFTKWLRDARTVQLLVTFSMSCQIFVTGTFLR